MRTLKRRIAGGLLLTVLAAGAPLAGADDLPVNNPNALLGEARAFIAEENWRGALDSLKTARAMAADDADFHNLLGFAHRNLGELAEAEIAYRRALVLDPDHLGALEYQGELFLMQGDLDAAQGNLARLAALCGDCEEHEELAEAIAAQQ